MESTPTKLAAMRKEGVTPKILRAMRELQRAQEAADQATEVVRTHQAKLQKLIEGSRAEAKAKKQKEAPKLNRKGWRMDGIIGPASRRNEAPLRTAVRYNDAENADLRASWNDGKGLSIKAIASLHQRSDNGIFTQLQRLGVGGLPASYSFGDPVPSQNEGSSK